MAKGSDNPYPSVLITESTAPATPASGNQRVYIDSTSHHLTRKNASGTVVDIETAAGGVTSAIGTTNQVVVSASTGAVTFSTPQDINTTSSVTFKSVAAGGLTGVTAATRYVGGLATGGTPGSGTFVTGDWLIGQDGTVYVCTSGGSPGTWAAAGGGSSALTKLTESTVSGSVAASITLSSISGSYRALQLRITASSDNAGTPDILIRPNNSSSAIYDWASVNIGNSTGATGYGGAGGGTSMTIGQSSGTSAPANTFNHFMLDLIEYASTSHNKVILSRGGRFDLTSVNNQYTALASGIFRSTSAITSLVFTLSAGNFAIGTVVSLYGVS